MEWLLSIGMFAGGTAAGIVIAVFLLRVAIAAAIGRGLGW